MDLVLCQIWPGWMPSSSRRGSSSSNEADPDTPEVEIVPPKDPDDDAAEPISKDMKGMAEEEDGGRKGWNGAVGTRRWLMFPTVGLTPALDGKITGGTVNSLVIFKATAILYWVLSERVTRNFLISFPSMCCDQFASYAFYRAVN